MGKKANYSISLNNKTFYKLMTDKGYRPEAEYKFQKGRRWKFDFAFPQQKLAVEIEGGIFTRQAHGSITGMLRDIEKYSEAAADGWRIIRVLPSNITKDNTINLIIKALRYNEKGNNENQVQGRKIFD